MIVPEWIASISLGQLLTIFTLLGIALTTGRKVSAPLRKFSRLVDDIIGEPARPGFPARPGILERMEKLETSYDVISLQMAELKRLIEENHKVDK